MVEADPVMRAGRNAFLVTIVLLLGFGLEQVVRTGSATTPVALTWVGGILAFLGSKYYYRRSETTGSDEPER